MPLKDFQSGQERRTVAEVNEAEREESRQFWRRVRVRVMWLAVGFALGLMMGCATLDRTAFEWDERERGWFYKGDRTIECIVMSPDGAYCHEWTRTAGWIPRYNELRPY